MHSARPWKYFQAFSLRSNRNISLWAGDSSRKYLFVFSDLKRTSCAGVDVASDNLKMRMSDTSGCRSSLSLLSTWQVCHMNYPPFCVVSVKCQHWGDEGIDCSVPMELLTALDACTAVRVLQEGKVLSRNLELHACRRTHLWFSAWEVRREEMMELSEPSYQNPISF